MEAALAESRRPATWRPIVAAPPSGDRPEDPRGTDAGQDSPTSIDEPLADEQALADREQMLAEVDQTRSDTDQIASESDQDSADLDQEASDLTLAHGGDAETHRLTSDARDLSAARRRLSAFARVEAATVREAAADVRDRAALERDRMAEWRDRTLAERDAAWAGGGRAETALEILGRAARDRERAAADRAAAAEYRVRAARDRRQAAHDRERAAQDRARDRADRKALLRQLAVAETDGLTGSRTRGAGLADLEHEIDRARRTGSRLVVAYADVVGLKIVNDTQGHAAGDALLQHAVAAIRRHLRSYDLIVRVGGDEFLCVMSGATLSEARRRFDSVASALASDPFPCAIRVGFADLADEDTAARLVERADEAMPTGSRTAGDRSR